MNTVNLECGCFMTVFTNAVTGRGGFAYACCSEHEPDCLKLLLEGSVTEVQ